MKITGIYQITNILNNKIYIGSSQDCYHRWNRHKSELNRNIHKNIHLQTAWNKYGANNFKLSIIEQCYKDKLLIREQYYLDSTKCLDNNFGYNMQPKAHKVTKISKYGKLKMSLGGKMQRGRKHTKEAKQKMSLSQKGKQKEHLWKMVYQFNLDGYLINEYKNVSDASKETNICDRAIADSANPNGKSNTAGGYIWSYNKQIKIPKRTWKKQKTLQYDLNNILINIYDTAEEASIATGINGSNIRFAASHAKRNGKMRVAGGFYWKYEE